MDKHIETLVQRYPQLDSCKDDILKAYQILEEAYSAGRKLLVAGNGGSASDSEHIVGELMKEFKLKRKIYAAQIDRLMQIDAEMGTVLADHLQGSLPAISLVGEPSLTTAFMNDAVPVLIFAQQVNGLGRAGDVFLGISTSGNSKNVLYAAVAAKSADARAAVRRKLPCRKILRKSRRHPSRRRRFPNSRRVPLPQLRMRRIMIMTVKPF